jgi:hypothetical protein
MDVSTGFLDEGLGWLPDGFAAFFSCWANTTEAQRPISKSKRKGDDLIRPWFGFEL